jgi:gliding motility-associated-like protein
MKNNVHYFVFFAFCMSLHAVYAQKEGNVWHFGRGAALDFNTGTAVITAPSSMFTPEGCASISDADGNLLFYTNGGGRIPSPPYSTTGKIWNRNHEVMYDMGIFEGGGYSAIQSSVIIPKPGSPNHYYLFTMEEFEFDPYPARPLGRGLSYFEVDMSLNGGLGGVVNYKEAIFTPSVEGICAVRHTNGSDYWIIVNNGNIGWAVFGVSAGGISAPQFFNGVSGGEIKASPDGKWVSMTRYLYQFDAATGKLNNPLWLDPFFGWREFSPNSKRLFINSFTIQSLCYFDLTSPDIKASKVDIIPFGDSSVFSEQQMQLAPDGKIYISQVGFGEYWLSTIVCPNTAPFVEFKKIKFDASIYFGSLPNFDNAIFRQDDDPLLPVDLGADKSICAGQNIVLDAGPNATGYSWSTGAQTPSLSVDSAGTYIVTVTGAGCSAGKDTIVVSPFTVAAGDDQIVCRGDTVQLSAAGTGVLSWSPPNLVSDASILSPFFTGDNNNTTLVITANSNGCTARDTVDLLFFDKPSVEITPKDTTIVVGTSAQLSVTGIGTTVWSPAAGLSCVDCASPIATPDTTTTYKFVRTNEAGCSISDSIRIRVAPDCTPKIPNAFTPNNDTINDGFLPIGEAIESYNLTIYNRWGQEVFQGVQPWNGVTGGKDAPCDVYIYKVDIQICDTVKTYLGEVTLIR